MFFQLRILGSRLQGKVGAPLTPPICSVTHCHCVEAEDAGEAAGSVLQGEELILS